jgi:hypothetical protein
MSMKTLLAFASFCTLVPAAAAQSFQFTLDPGTSTTGLTSTLTWPMPGTAIGNYDATNVPDGTRTLPGLFGGSGNQPVTVSPTLVGDSNFSGAPTGTFTATVDANAGVVVISDLIVDGLGTSQGTTDLTVDLSYQTFRTFAPNSLYIGGFTLPLPLGQVVASNIRFEQTGASALGTITPTGVQDFFDVAIVVPANLSFDVDFLGNATSVGPVPFALPMIGTLDMTGAAPVLALSVDQSGNQTVVDPLGGQTIDNLALDLPTILPTGGTAHLLFNLAPGDLAFDFAADLQWFAGGAPVCDVTNYCVSTPNTAGPGARIAANGSTSLTLNNLELYCDGIPALHPGRFYVGSKQTLAPFGDGVLCVGGTGRRFAIAFTDAQGVARTAIDFQDPAQPGGVFTPGSSWNFQFVYRDPLGAAATFNTSDAMQITFCP